MGLVSNLGKGARYLRYHGLPSGRLARKAWQVWRSGHDKMAGRDSLSARPLRLHFEINDYCNLKCVMCSRESDIIPKDTGALSLESVKKLAPFLESATYVGIAGNGEPFMHRELLDILEYIRSFDCVPSVITNCTLLRQPACDRLVKLGPTLLMASIDGGTKEVFETIRKGANFERIVENLERLRDTKKAADSAYPVVNFITCLMRENLHDLPNVVRLAHRVGAAEINVQNLFPYHDGAWEHIVADFDAIDEKIVEARDLAHELGVRVNYNPMGFSIETRLEHARSKGSAFAPTSGLQLNGRESEIKTVGKLLEGPAAQKLLPAPAAAVAIAMEKKEEPVAVAVEAATESNGASHAEANGNGASNGNGAKAKTDVVEPQAAEPKTKESEASEAHSSPRGNGLDLTLMEGGIFDDDYVPDAASGTAADFARAQAHVAGAGCAGMGTAGEGLSAETHRVVVPTVEANAVEGEPKYYCQNVFQQFHVNVQGEARVCCFWTRGSLGNVHEKSVEEMWNSPQFRGVRRQILKGDVPFDCRTCHHLVPFDREAIRADMWREVREALKLQR